MNRYRVCGTVSVDVYAEIDAPTLEDALEYARDNYRMIDWCEDYSELVEENVETETDIWGTEEENEEEDED